MCQLFEETFLHILHSKPATSKELEEEFSSLLGMAKIRHLELGQNISEALQKIRCSGNGEWIDPSGNLLYVDDTGQGQVQDLFRRFYSGRIGIRLLVDTHLALRNDVLGETSITAKAPDVVLGQGPLSYSDYQRYVWKRMREKESESSGQKYYSVLHPRCNIFDMVVLAVEDAKIASSREVSEACGYRMTDEIEVEFEGDLDLILPMIPEHLYIITTEIVANAIRANAERHGPTLGMSGRPDRIPAVRVTLSRGPSHFYMKISDQGGGVAYENAEKIWKFSYSASHFRYSNQTDTVGPDAASLQSLHESRVSRQGLPLSRLYARYWGGDVTMISMENWGCDFLLRIPLVALPGEQLIIPDLQHDDPLSRGGCHREKCSYPFAFFDHSDITQGSGTSLFTAPLR